jgi:DNA-binding response OmpR family regulator
MCWRECTSFRLAFVTPLTKDIPTIVLTGRKDAALKRKLLNLGAVRYFTKPYNIAKLVGELRRHIHLPVFSGKSRRSSRERCMDLEVNEVRDLETE